jgi:hypothetical protein
MEGIMNSNENDEVIAETENLTIWRSREDMGYLYHIELGSLSLHLFPDEWEELVSLVMQAASK